MGVATRAMSSPLGRVQRASSRPTGSGKRGDVFDALGHRFDALVVERQPVEHGAGARLPPWPPAMSCALAARMSALAARMAAAAASSALFLVSVDASRSARAPPRARLRPCASISASSASVRLSARSSRRLPSAPDRRDGSSRRGHDSREWPRFRRVRLPAMRSASRGAIGGKPARDFAARAGRLHQHRIAALEAAVDLADAGGQQALAFGQRLGRAGIDDQRAFAASARRRSSACAPRRAWRWRESAWRARRCATAASGCVVLPLAMMTSQPAAVAILRRDQFGRHAAAADAGDRAARHRFDLGRDGGDFGNMRGVGIARRIGGVEPVDVGEQHQAVGFHHARRRARPAGHCRRSGFRRSPPCRSR